MFLPVSMNYKLYITKLPVLGCLRVCQNPTQEVYPDSEHTTVRWIRLQILDMRLLQLLLRSLPSRNMLRSLLTLNPEHNNRKTCKDENVMTIVYKTIFSLS